MFKTWKIDEILCRIMHKTDVYKNWIDYCKRDKSMEENKKRNIWPEIEMLAPGVWNIEFGFGNTVYVVEGSKKAIVIDTGMSDAQILPVIKTLTNKSLELAITHVHGDHMRYASDFSVRYMCDRDVAIADQMLDRFDMPQVKQLTYQSVHEWDVLDLGNVTLQVISMYGHTPGSVGYYCKEKNMLFCGDAIGSGMGVWMYVPHALKLEEYRKSLNNFISWAKKQPPMKFFSGHRIMNFAMPALDKPFIESMQAAEIAWKNKTPINEPNVKMAQNLYDLCGDILQKKTVGIPRADMSGGGGTVPLMAMKDNAAILYTEELI